MTNNTSHYQKTPSSFLCQLTGEIMKDPVMDREGNTYERSSITVYLKTHTTSPITNKPLALQDLIPNRALKLSIEEWQVNSGINTTQSPNTTQSINNNTITFTNNTNPATINISSQSVSRNSSNNENLQLEAFRYGDHTMISIKPPEQFLSFKRTPSTLCCVIDVSGSMASEAQINTGSGRMEGFGFSTLDLVKHSVRTIIESLGDDDQLALVSFENQAQIVLNPTRMSKEGKLKAELALEKLEPSGMTNLWDGLLNGLEMLRKEGDLRNAQILLLTDGMPNINPPRGIAPMLEKYRDEQGISGIINTVGFGYSLDSPLLNDLAVLGKGNYAFIPDGSLVGTIFVNSLANILTTAATNLSLELRLDKSNIQIPDLSLIKHHNHSFKPSNNLLNINLGTMGFGQSKNFVLPINYLKNEQTLAMSLSYKCPFTKKNISLPFVEQVVNQNSEEIIINKFRLTFSNYLLKLGETYKNVPLDNQAEQALLHIVQEIRNSPVSNDSYVKDLISDIEGQAILAVSKNEHFMKWGKHYLPSLARAHLQQQCNNFKDPGVQHYGGRLFRELRDELDALFLTVPPPKASAKSANSSNFVGMGVFYNNSNPCFEGNSEVKMFDGSFKKVRDIRKGDLIMGPNNISVKVECVLKTETLNGKADFVEFKGGLRITPYHPIRINGKFFFPCTFGDVVSKDCDYVYSFVVEKEHIVTINGIECITMGHNFTNDDIAKHPYFGSRAVVEDLKRLRGWKNGVVEINSNFIVRDEKTGLMNGIKKPSLFRRFRFIFDKNYLKINEKMKNVSGLNLMNKFALKLMKKKFI